MFDSPLQFKGFESHDTGYYHGLWRDAQKLNLSNKTVSKDKPNLTETFSYVNSTIWYFFQYLVLVKRIARGILAVLINCFPAVQFVRYIHLISAAYASENLSDTMCRF